jgi:Spy/CpxP family protein refolding chaperone
VAIVLLVPTSIDSVRWWRSSRIADRLRLSTSQAAAIDEIYQGSRAQAATCARDSAEARRQLEVVLMSDGADDAFATTGLRVAEIEATCRRARTVMLYRMFRQLSPRQRQRLAEFADGQRTSRPRFAAER